MSDLERANAELRWALRIAAKRINQLNFGRRNDPVLDLLRRTWRETKPASLKEAAPIKLASKGASDL